MEELVPGYKMDIDVLDKVWYDNVVYLKYYVKSWKIMNQKLINEEINQKEYIEIVTR